MIVTGSKTLVISYATTEKFQGFTFKPKIQCFMDDRFNPVTKIIGYIETHCTKLYIALQHILPLPNNTCTFLHDFSPQIVFLFLFPFVLSQYQVNSYNTHAALPKAHTCTCILWYPAHINALNIFSMCAKPSKPEI